MLQGRELTAQRLRHGTKALVSVWRILPWSSKAISTPSTPSMLVPDIRPACISVRVGEVCLGSGADGGVVLHGAWMPKAPVRRAHGAGSDLSVGSLWPGLSGCRAARCRRLFERGHRGGFSPAHQVDDLLGLRAAGCGLPCPGRGRLGQHGVGIDLLAVDLELKCRCGPVAQPVWPTSPMTWPCFDLVAQAQLGREARHKA